MENFISRRTFLQSIGSIGALTAFEKIVPAYSQTENAAQIGKELSGDVINLNISETPVMIDKWRC